MTPTPLPDDPRATDAPRRFTRRTFGLLGAAAAGSAALTQLAPSRAYAAPTERLRVVTFNIFDGLTYQEYRADLEKAVAGGQLVCLQEIARRHADLDRFGKNRGWHVRYTTSNAVLADAERFEHLAEGSFGVDGDPVTINPPRNITWMRLRDRRTNRVITVFCTHAWAQIEAGGRPRSDRADRVEGNRRLLTKLRSVVEDAAERGEVVVGGDFNVNWSLDKEAADERFPWVILERRRNGDVRALRSHYTGAAGEATHTRKNPSRRIDYVYHWRRLEGNRVLRPVGSRRIFGNSDHLGVSATFDLDVRPS